MAKKKTSKPTAVVEPAKSRHRYLLIGVFLVVALAITVAAVAVGVFGSGGGSSSTTPAVTTAVALNIPPPAAPEPISRSAAAGMLANKTFDAMTQAERDLVKTEVERVFDNGAFRGSSSAVPAIDVYRVDGHTRVSRQFKAGAPPNDSVTVQTLVFYCDSADGNIAAYGYNIEPGNVTSGGRAMKAQAQPFDALISGLDWSQAKDLGYETIAGHRAHGFEMPYRSPLTGTTVTARDWFDVDSARIIRTDQAGGADAATYTFDWSVPAPVDIPAGQPVPSCADVFFASVPSARPRELASSTPPASATP